MSIQYSMVGTAGKVTLQPTVFAASHKKRHSLKSYEQCRASRVNVGRPTRARRSYAAATGDSTPMRVRHCPATHNMPVFSGLYSLQD